MWSEIINIIEQNHRFIISSHQNPDCDALGSELALAWHLKQGGKDVAIINADPVIDEYLFLDPQTLIKQFSTDPVHFRQVIDQAEVIFVVDASGGWHRLGDVGAVLEQAHKLSVCIDHHPADSLFTDTGIVDTDVIATGELIFDLIVARQGQITALMAQALYAAILTDSGSFRFPKTSSNTHRIIASLLEYGAEPDKIYQRLYQQQPLNRVQLRGHVLSSIKLTAANQIAYTSLDKATLDTYQTDPGELNAFSNLAQDIKGVRVAIFAVELPDGKIKLSLRSDGSVPVNQIVAELGGGGHVAAAGATVTGTLAEVVDQVIARTEALL